KPKGFVSTNHDPEGRPTLFEVLPQDLPRVMTVGRLDINTEGLLLLTNDGGLARVLELPATGWLRRYRVRAFGHITQAQLDTVRDGVVIDGEAYGPVIARFEREQGSNTWLIVDLREGRNREVKKVLEHLGLAVNRLIRVSFGPFQLGDLAEGEVDEVRSRVLKDQLGDELMREAGIDLNAPRRDDASAPRREEFVPRKEEAPRFEDRAPRAAPSGDDRPRRSPSDERETSERPMRRGSHVSQDERTAKPWLKTTWRDEEADGLRAKRNAPPRRGADPKDERAKREAEGTVSRRRDKAIEDPKGRRVLVERVASASREETPKHQRVQRMAKPGTSLEDLVETGAASNSPWQERPRDEERPRRQERTGGYERSGSGERSGGRERPFGDRSPRDGARPPRDGDRPARRAYSSDKPRGEGRTGERSFGDRPDRPAGDRPARSGFGKPAGRFGGERSGGERSGSDRPRGDRPGGDRPRGDRPSGGRPGGDRPRGDRPGGGRPTGGRPGGGRGKPRD
ncbi:MAG: pseudouridine synthase, partial [Bosea sp. (in: a-proteobacteria)]